MVTELWTIHSTSCHGDDKFQWQLYPIWITLASGKEDLQYACMYSWTEHSQKLHWRMFWQKLLTLTQIESIVYIIISTQFVLATGWSWGTHSHRDPVSHAMMVNCSLADTALSSVAVMVTSPELASTENFCVCVCICACVIIYKTATINSWKSESLPLL